jgi:hypothetical protein
MRNKRQSNYEEQLKPLLETKQNYIKEGKKALGEIFSKFFEENPDALYVFWQQYTPYFNDGEQCEFGVGSIYSLSLDKEIVEAKEESMGVKFPKDKDGNQILPTTEYVLNNLSYDCVDFENMDDELEQSVTPCTTEQYFGFFTSTNETNLENALYRISDILEEVLGDHIEVLVGRDLQLHTKDFQHE